MADQDDLMDSAHDDAEWTALARHLAGEGTPADRVVAERLIGRDPTLRHLSGVLDQAMPRVEPALPAAAEVEAALRSVLARRDAERADTPVLSLEGYRSRWRSARLRAAAAVLVVAGASLLWRSVSSDTPATTAAAPATYATQTGEIKQFNLPDGTRVALGPGSTLTLGAGYSGTARDLTLQGEARFDVEHDQARPFVVHTPSAMIRDVGTVFTVRSGPTNGARVAVVVGEVAVVSRASGDSARLFVGDRAAVAPGGSVVVVRGGVMPEDMGWEQGKLILRDVSVAQAVDDLRRWYGVDLRVDSALAAHRVSATFERGTSSNDIARVIAALLGGGVRQEGAALHIVAPPGELPQR